MACRKLPQFLRYWDLSIRSLQAGGVAPGRRPRARHPEQICRTPGALAVCFANRALFSG